MAKLEGIDPRKGRKTLGQALEELAGDNQLDSDTVAATAANKGSNAKDSQQAATVLSRNTYPASTNSLQNSANITRYTDARELNQGLVDVAPGALKAVGAIAKDTMEAYNRFVPGDVAGESTGGRRGDDLQASDANEAATFTSKVKNLGKFQSEEGVDNAEAAVNHFNNSSGGDSAVGSNGGFFTASELQLLIDKLGKRGIQMSALRLARESGGGQDNPNARPNNHSPIAQKVHDVLDRTNRYAPSEKSPYIKNPAAANEEEFYKDGLFSIQVGAGTLGVYDKNGKGVKTMDLSRMAMQLMVQAQSHNSLADMIDEGFAKGEAGGGSFLFDLAALIPGVTQIGAARIEQNLMRIKNTARAGELGIAGRGADDLIPIESGDVILGAGPSSKTPGQIDPRSAGSYGQMNSFVEPFDGPMPFGMFFIALYSILGLMILSLIIEGLMSGTDFGPEKSTSSSNAASPHTLELGFNPRGGGDDSIGALFFQLFGLPRLDFNLMTCLFRGIERFFDIPSIFELAGNFEAVLEAAVNLALAPGYYATITKQVLRDFEQITEAILALGINASVFNVIAGIFKVVEVLFSSFTFRFIVFLMNLGNIDLLSRKSFGVMSTGELIAPVDDKSKAMNAEIAMTPYSRMRLSRFGGSSNPLGLQFHPSLFNLPAYAIEGSNLGPNFKSVKGGEELKAIDIAGDLSKSRTSVQGRITKEQLAAVEEALDVEYMPFYIHDLRTDEVFSMPAFITEFSEDFAPEYNETHGYGRTDPVLIYSKTRRNMNVGFMLVAYSPADHDYLWFIINKLVAMCYPQRSAGQKRVMEGESKFFTQPFSQVPTASPLIRLRLGELVKSNYSKMSLARLFGLLGGPGKSNIGGEVSSDNLGMTFADKVFAKEIEIQLKEADSIEKFEKPSLDLIIPPGQTITVSNGSANIKGVSVQSIGNPDDPKAVKGVRLKIKKVSEVTRAGKKLVRIEGVIAEKGLFDSDSDVKKALYPLGSAAIKQLFPKIDDIPPDLNVFPSITITGICEFAPKNGYLSNYIFDPAQVRDEAVKDLKDDPMNPTNEDVVKFMDAKNNPIVASFESSRGRGLAGFITGLNFDYAEQQWDTRPGHRAPMVVNVSMTFSPVHDLPLGMDADGKLVAPSHPVGGFAMTDPYNDMGVHSTQASPSAELTAEVARSFNDAIGSRDDINKP